MQLSRPFLSQVCKYFIQAIENKKYGWFWNCPNGSACIYRWEKTLARSARWLPLEQRCNSLCGPRTKNFGDPRYTASAFSSGPHCLTAKQTALILRLYARCGLQYIVTVSIKRKRNPLSKGILSQPRIRHCDLIRVYNFACWVGIINSCSDRIYTVNIKSGCMVKSTKSGTILLVHLQQYQLDSFFCGQSNHYLNKQTYAEEK